MGRSSEERAALWLAERGYEIRERRWRTPFAEVDLLAYEPRSDRYVLIEVKTSRPSAWSDGAIGARQLERLRRARDWIEATYGKPVRAVLALVDPGGGLVWVPDFLC